MRVGRVFGGVADLVILLRGIYLIYRSLIVRYGFFAYTDRGGEIDRYRGKGDGGVTISTFAGDGAGRDITSRVGIAFAYAGYRVDGVGFSSYTKMTDTLAGCGNSGVGVFNTGNSGRVTSREVLDYFTSSRCYYLLTIYFTIVLRF